MSPEKARGSCRRRRGSMHQPAACTARTPQKLAPASAASFPAAQTPLLRRRVLAPSQRVSVTSLPAPSGPTNEREAPRPRGGATGSGEAGLVRRWSPAGSEFFGTWKSPLFSNSEDRRDETRGVSVVSLPGDVHVECPSHVPSSARHYLLHANLEASGGRGASPFRELRRDGEEPRLSPPSASPGAAPAGRGGARAGGGVCVAAPARRESARRGLALGVEVSRWAETPAFRGGSLPEREWGTSPSRGSVWPRLRPSPREPL